MRIQQGKACESSFGNGVMLIFVAFVTVIYLLFHTTRNCLNTSYRVNE